MTRPVRFNEPAVERIHRAPPAPSGWNLWLGRDDPVRVTPVGVAAKRTRKRRAQYHVEHSVLTAPSTDGFMSITDICELTKLPAMEARRQLRAAGIAAARKTQWKRMVWPRAAVLEWIAGELVEKGDS